jgi:protein TonB
VHPQLVSNSPEGLHSIGEHRSRAVCGAVRALVFREEKAMHNELFEEITAPAARNARSPWTIALSIAAHVVVIGVVVIVPLLATGALPTPTSGVGVFVPVAPIPPPPPPPAATPTPRVPPVKAAFQEVSYAEPDGISDETETPTQAVPTIVDVVGPTGPGVPDGIGSRKDYTPTPPPVQPQPVSGPLKVGGQIREPRRVSSVAPVYPAIARQARVQGTVVIQAVIGVDGDVRDAQILNSVPLLDQAALDAVRQWRYQPTLLNGTPVAVIMTVSVRFTLE